MTNSLNFPNGIQNPPYGQHRCDIGLRCSDKEPQNALSDQRFHDLTFVDIHGKTRSMSEFKGRYVLVVNTASECGYTPQYKELQALHQQWGSKITILGFPCNDFGGQEPGDEKV